MSRIIHPNEPQYVLELIRTYTEAQQRLINVIGQKHARKTNTMYERRILGQTNAILRDLIDEAKIWTNSNIPRAYKKGVNKAIKAYKDLGVDTPDYDDFSKLHTRTINVMIENATDDLVNSTNFIGRQIKDNVRSISLDAVKQARITGQSVQQLRQELIGRFVDNNITSIMTKNGRRINLDSYAEVVARSTVREAENRAQIEQVKASGRDLVRMSSHATSCPICAPLQGRVYSISGNDPEYPALDVAYSGSHANIHPNCRHSLSPYVPELDSNVARTKEISNRSFDTDPRSKTQIDAYNNEQKKNRERNRDKRQWERYRILLPQDTPKTLAGFRKSKQANSEKFKKLQSKYRSMRRSSK